MPLVSIAALIVGVLTLLGLVAAGYVIIRSSATKQAAESWRDESEAQKARADRLAEQVTELNTGMVALTARIAVLEADKTRLEASVTAQPQIAALTILTEKQHAETLSAIFSATERLSGETSGA